MVVRRLERWLGANWGGFTAEHRSILQGMLAVGVYVLFAKVVGAAKELAVAWRFGVGAEVDAYLFVTNLINLPVSVWFSVLIVILIPLAARIRHDTPEQLRSFRAELLALTLIIGAILAIASLVGLPRLLTSDLLGLPPRTALLAVQMVPVLAWLAPLGVLVGLYSTWTMSAGRHVNTLLEGVPALGILCAVLLAGGVESLMWGILAGTLVQLAMLVIGERSLGLPTFSLSSPQWRPFWQGFGIMMAGQAVISLTTVVDQFFAARLGEGAISALGYAGRILALVLSLVATAVTRATLPVFSRSQTNAAVDVHNLALRWGRLLALVGLVVMGVGWILAPWGVQLLFERGTFTSGDTAIVVRLFRLGLVQLPFYFSSLVLVSLYSSLGRYKILLASGVVGLSAKVIANYLLLPTFNVGALMLSNAAVYAANAMLLARARSR